MIPRLSISSNSDPQMNPREKKKKTKKLITKYFQLNTYLSTTHIARSLSEKLITVQAKSPDQRPFSHVSSNSSVLAPLFSSLVTLYPSEHFSKYLRREIYRLIFGWFNYYLQNDLKGFPLYPSEHFSKYLHRGIYCLIFGRFNYYLQRILNHFICKVTSIDSFWLFQCIIYARRMKSSKRVYQFLYIRRYKDWLPG